MSRHFSNWIQSYMEFTANSEAPDPLHFWTAVSTIAGALRRRVWREEFEFQWTPNFYIFFVAPPGVATKSTSISIGQKLLREVPDVKIGPSSATWQGLTVALEEAKKAYPLDAMATEFVQFSGLTCSISELGTFFDAKDTKLVDLLVEMWDGKICVWEHRIKTGDNPSTQITNPWLNLIGCTTPAWLRGNFPAYLIEGGLTSRSIFVFADKKRHFNAYPSQGRVVKDYHELKQKLIEDLTAISNLLGNYEITEEAITWGTEWYQHHWRPERPSQHMSSKYGGYYARKQTHIHKLAMVLAASESDRLVITLAHLQMAERIVTATENDLARVFKTIGSSDDSRAMAEILAVVRAANRIDANELWRRMMTDMPRKDFENALKGLLDAKHIWSLKLDDRLHYCLGTAADAPEAAVG